MEQFDLSPELKQLYEKKQKQRAAAKEYYRNIIYNPYRPINEGPPFDPGLHRYNAMSAYHLELLKPNAKTYFGFLAVLAPIVLYGIYIEKSRKKKEEILRSGVVKYEDRQFKLMY